MELFNDTVKSMWEIIRPQLGKVLAILLTLLLLYIVIFKILVPSIFPDKNEKKVEVLQQINGVQQNTINVLKGSNDSQAEAIKQLGAAAEATDTALNDILTGRSTSTDNLINNLDHTSNALSQIKTDKALANQNTKQLIERKAQQKLVGEDVTGTDKLIKQSVEAAKALDQKHATVVIDSLWSMYDDVNK